jgi:hypothetical protein
VPPEEAAEGSRVCGTQCDQDVAANGGVYQTVTWTGPGAILSVTARAYSETWNGTPYPGGCGVRMGLVPSATTNRGDVTQWISFPWGPDWSTLPITIPGPGTYTLFIEAHQPDPSLVMSTLWDNVDWLSLPPVTLADGPDAAVPTESTATITWQTNVESTSKVEYGLTPSYGQCVELTTPTVNHSIPLSGLINSSTYHYRVVSTATGYAPLTSSDYTFATPIQFSDITTSVSADGLSTVVMWRTDVPTSSQVEYGETAGYGHLTTENTNLVEEHSVSISGLIEDHLYHFRVWGRNAPQYTAACSLDNVFTTLPYPTNALQNGDFELGHAGFNPSLYPWVQYTLLDEGYYPIDGIVGPFPSSGTPSWYQGIKAQNGSYFIGAGGQRKTKNGGVLQRIFVTPGDVYTIGMHYATYRQGGTSKTCGSDWASTPTAACPPPPVTFSGGARIPRPTTANGTGPRSRLKRARAES